MKAGDLVMVVKPSTCCGSASAVGKVFVVNEVSETWILKCSHCAAIFDGKASSLYEEGVEAAVLVSRLIKIDPPELPESVEIKEELPA